jgi:predicted O-methyltransferase YrrM
MNAIKALLKFFHPAYKTFFLEYDIDRSSFYGRGMPVHKKLSELLSKNHTTYTDILLQCLEHAETFATIAYDGNGIEPAWHNKYISGFDLITLYSFISHYKPKQYFEIGSGTSTKMVYKAIRDNYLKTKIISIDPHPRENVRNIADEYIGKTFGLAEAESIVQRANKDDIVFIDASHRIFSNSDCMFFFLEVLPNLKKGVIVHFHDIYLPFDYPRIDRERYYSEQFGLAIALLEHPERYSVLLPNYYVSKNDELRSLLAPLWKRLADPRIETHGCSLWLQIDK